MCVEHAEAQKKAEQEKEMAENATFKPQLNKKKKKDELFHFNVGQGSSGLNKYLLRQEKIRQNKVEQEMHNAKVFNKGENWKPVQTVPKTPRIS